MKENVFTCHITFETHTHTHTFTHARTHTTYNKVIDHVSRAVQDGAHLHDGGGISPVAIQAARRSLYIESSFAFPTIPPTPREKVSTAIVKRRAQSTSLSAHRNSSNIP